MLPLSVRLSAVGAASTILVAVATFPYATDTQARPSGPGIGQRAAPVQHMAPAPAFRAAPMQHMAPAPVFRAAPMQHVAPAPVFRAAPVQHVAPRVVMPPPMSHVFNGFNGPVHAAPTFTPHQNGNNFQAVNPNLQHINPSLPLNNPSALRPNVPLNNPSALRPNPQINNANALRPNVPPNNASVLRVNPSPVREGSTIRPQDPNTLRHGPSQPPVNSALLRPGTGGSQQIRPAFPAVNLHNKFWPIFKDSKFMWVGGHRRFFTPVGLLGIILLGGSYWYPDGYVSMEGPACTGYAQNGCQLQWRMVDFEDGGSEPQCVQYCPYVGSPPPPEQVATLPPPPPPLPENGACQVTIYSEPNFAGTSAPTGASQPDLSETGWRNEISSIVVGAGIWDFFTDEKFGGESIRLPPGTYPTLSEEWTRKIGSFMCVQPGPPGA